MLDNWIKLIKGHERLLLALLAAALGWYGWHTYMSYREHELVVNADLKGKELANAKDASDKAATAVANQTATANAVDAQATKAIANLQAQIATLNKELAAQQKSDSALTDAGLANRWATLTGLGASDLLPQSGGLSVTHTAAIATVQKLDEVAALEDKTVNQQGIIDQQAGQITAKNDLIASLQVEVKADAVTLAKQVSDDQAHEKLAVQQEHDKKAKGGWLVRGLIFVGGIIVGHKI